MFDAARYRSLLPPTAPGEPLVYRETVDSTMVLARELAAGGSPSGTIVLAEEQTAGRGRRGRSFWSPPGENLYFTLVLRLPAGLRSRLPVALPLAVCEGVRAEGVEALIKWPNDIWVGERKLCGMLIDAETAADGQFIAYPGVGINVNGDPTRNPELRETATSVARQLGREVDREQLLARIMGALDLAFSMERAALADRYRRVSMVLGRRVTVSESAGGSYEALAQGIDDDGALVVERGDGTLVTLLAAEVSVRPA